MRISQKPINFAVSLLLLASVTAGSSELSKLDLLIDYFSDGAVCSTAQVVDIESVSTGLTVLINIEPATRQAVHKMSETNRDDWFSLHCPPEHHLVWADNKGGFDVTVEEILNFGRAANPESGTEKSTVQKPQYALSCAAYIKAQYEQRLSYRERVRLKLDKLLNR